MEPLESIHQQCLRTRKIGGWFDHPNRGIIEISGTDRIQFLHNILTNDIKTLVPGTGTQACLLTAQAKIIAAVNVLCFKNLIWLAFDYVLRKQLHEALEKLIIMEQVALKDRSGELKLISIHGAKVKDLIATAFNQQPPNQLLDHTPIGRPADQFAGTGTEIIRINLIGEEGFGILFPKNETEKIRKLIEECASSLEMVKIEPAAMEIMRITAGLSKYGTDYDESNIPLECLLDHTISFTKGCFPGQEIIARLDSRNGVGKKLCGLVLKGESIPKKNDRVLDNVVEVGHITSAAFDPLLKETIALGYLKKGSWEVGHPLVVEIGTDQIPARVEELPFYSKS